MKRPLPMPPGGDPALAPLADSRMYWHVQRARLQWAVRERFQSIIGNPLERVLFGVWEHGLPGAAQVERRGLLRRVVERELGSDLDVYRHDLSGSEAFRYYKAQLDAGKPWRSHQKGVLLDSEARILAYLGVYLSFLDDMAVRGFDAWRGKDDLGVAVSRAGRLLKINRGLHLLMAK